MVTDLYPYRFDAETLNSRLSSLSKGFIKCSERWQVIFLRRPDEHNGEFYYA